MSKDKTYEICGGDWILGTLDLPDPCPVRVVLTPEYVKLYVGPRDWQWYRDTGKVMGSGTRLPANPAEEVPDEETV
jgi:hypothetical protein